MARILVVGGTDYDTRDGTCVRDYVHVTDLCDAHLLAMDQLLKGSVGSVYNLGNGEGFSVREVVETVREVSGRDFVVTETNRRAGDPAVLVANASRAKVDLNWHPTFGSIEAIVGDA